jgi:ribosomal protein S18 acetylase RimI-like enzyme
MMEWMVTVRTADTSDMDGARDFIRRMFPDAMVSISEDDVIVLAEYGRKIVGFAHVIDAGDRIILQGLAVDGSVRGLGVGTLLLQHILGTVDDDMPVVLKVKTMNPAIDLYARHGFFVKRSHDHTLTLVKKPNC